MTCVCDMENPVKLGPYVISPKGITYAAVYRVYSDTGLDLEPAAAAAVTIPLYDQLGVGIESYVIEKRVEFETADKRQFLVSLSWGQPDKPEDNTAPWERVAEKSFDFGQGSINVIQDIDGNFMKNKAGDGFQGIDMDFAKATYCIKKNYQIEDFDMTLPTVYANAINGATWAGGAEATWKVKNIKVTRMWEQRWGFWYSVEYQFEFNALTWDKKILNAGLNQIVASKKVPIVKGGQPITEPYPLDNSGVALADGSTSYVYLTFQIYQRMDFSIFNIT